MMDLHGDDDDDVSARMNTWLSGFENSLLLSNYTLKQLMATGNSSKDVLKAVLLLRAAMGPCIMPVEASPASAGICHGMVCT